MEVSILAHGRAPRAETVRAAARLLLDANPRVHRICEERLLAWGPVSRAPLESLCECGDAAARARVRSVLRAVNVRSWAGEFRVFAAGAEPDLEQGLLLLARLPRPLLATDRVGRRLDEWAARLAPRIVALGPRRLAVSLRRLFHDELGFRGDRRSYYDPDNSFLDQVVWRRRGVPITLSAVYLLVGRRLGLPLEGIGLPGHFLVRARGARSVLVDPFHDGRIVTRRDCVERLQAMGYGFRDSLLEPLSDRRMLIRSLGNLGHTSGFGDDNLLVDAVQKARRALAEGG